MLNFGAAFGAAFSFICGVGTSQFYHNKMLKGKKLTLIETNRFYLYNKSKEFIDGLEINYNGKLIDKNFMILEGCLANTGILDMDLNESVLFELPPNNDWEFIKIENNDDLEFKIDKETSKICLLIKNEKKEYLLKKNEYIQFKAFIQFEDINLNMSSIKITQRIPNLNIEKYYFMYEYYNSINYLRYNTLEVFLKWIFVILIDIGIVIALLNREHIELIPSILAFIAIGLMSFGEIKNIVRFNKINKVAGLIGMSQKIWKKQKYD